VNAYSQLAVSGDGKTLATVLTNVDSSIAYYKGDGGAMISSTPLRITPSSFVWTDEDHLLLITHDSGISKLDRATGAVQPIDTGDLDMGAYINTCPDGHVVFVAIPRGGGESRVFRMDADGGGVTQITTAGIARAPFCTPDSQKVYFTIRGATNGPNLALWSVSTSGGTAQKEFDFEGFVPLLFARDARLGVTVYNANLNYFLNFWDIASHRMVHQLPLNVSNIHGSFLTFSPDGKAVVGAVSANGGSTAQYQPIDGSPTHLMIDPTPELLTWAAMSPSGSKLGITKLRRSSDVVLITDLAGKQPH
jgi:eukaryotic-like serine/threonine-protein kinase